MPKPTGADLRAVAGVLDLIDRLELAEQTHTPAWERSPRRNAWFAFRILVQAIPPDRRLQAIDQAVAFADPDLLQTGPLVDFFESWTGDNASAFLTDLTGIAVERSQSILATDGARAAVFDDHLRRDAEPDLIRSRPLDPST